MREAEGGLVWLVLLYQFPKGPDSRRVKIWRRLQTIGAVAIKNSVYVLPLNDQSQEDFEWLLTELKSGGAEAALLESRFVDGMSDQQIRDLFNAARAADYQTLLEEVETAAAGLPKQAVDDGDATEQVRRALARARKRLGEIEAIDFFGAEGLEAVEEAIRTLDDRTSAPNDSESSGAASMSTTALDELSDRVWVTRPGVRVDRIASAWLIRRWIDPAARFKFVAGRGYKPDEREIRFDMFEAEFTHQGDLCTFEVLARMVGPEDRALHSVGEIVHDIDLKDGKFGRPETEGIANLISGIVAGSDDDDQRIERGAAMFEDLYRFFGAASI